MKQFHGDKLNEKEFEDYSWVVSNSEIMGLEYRQQKGREQNRKPQKISFLLNTQTQAIPKTILNTEKISNPPQNEYHVVKRLNHEKDMMVALAYFKSVANGGDAEVPFFKHTHLTYKTMIDKLGQEKEFLDGVQYLLQQMKLEGISCSEDIFISVIDSYKRAGLAEQALKTFYRIRDFDCKPTVKIYNHVLDALLNENKFQMIIPIYNNMKKDGVELNVFTYNILLKALCKNNRVDGAHGLLVEMSKKGCSPDDVSYTTIVSSLCKLGRLKEARELIARVNPIVPAYNALINGFCRHLDIKEAFILLDEMMSREIVPNVITYTTIIDALSNTMDVDQALVVLAQMFVRGCQPNIRTFTSLMNGFFRKGAVHEALDVWDRMAGEGCDPNVVTYNTVLHGLCINENLDMALSFFDQMEVSGISPNVRTYTTLIDGLGKSGDLDGAAKMWNRMVTCGCRPNIVAFTCMVDALCRRRMFNQAYFLIENMKLEDCPPNTVTFNTLIKGLCSSKRVDWAMEVFDEMEKHGSDCSPNATTFNELLDGLNKEGNFEEAFRLVKDMMTRGIDFNLVTYNTMIYGLSTAGMVDEAAQYFGRMVVTGIHPDTITFNTFIHAYSKQGNVSDALKLMEGMTEQGCNRDIVTYTSLIYGLCEICSSEEAMIYLDKLLKEGLSPNSATWNGTGFCENMRMILVQTLSCASEFFQIKLELICVSKYNTCFPCSKSVLGKLLRCFYTIYSASEVIISSATISYTSEGNDCIRKEWPQTLFLASDLFSKQALKLEFRCSVNIAHASPARLLFSPNDSAACTPSIYASNFSLSIKSAALTSSSSQLQSTTPGDAVLVSSSTPHLRTLCPPSGIRVLKIYRRAGRSSPAIGNVQAISLAVATSSGFGFCNIKDGKFVRYSWIDRSFFVTCSVGPSSFAPEISVYDGVQLGFVQIRETARKMYVFLDILPSVAAFVKML
ncbi:hypothetical protein C5167_011606 [Papaver somniferum]|uniref:Uncharacterized protein n=1 Tax=Papaver somniferum TaxID=3469 RepID=A0A4Y7K6F3_PAPSO|nr:hypothetical protein C5167_011606 [Papaver somniferum]